MKKIDTKAFEEACDYIEDLGWYLFYILNQYTKNNEFETGVAYLKSLKDREPSCECLSERQEHFISSTMKGYMEYLAEIQRLSESEDIEFDEAFYPVRFDKSVCVSLFLKEIHIYLKENDNHMYGNTIRAIEFFITEYMILEIYQDNKSISEKFPPKNITNFKNKYLTVADHLHQFVSQNAIKDYLNTVVTHDFFLA